MLRSMTGFGRFCHEAAGYSQTWEVRSVNGRHLDIKWRLPADVRGAEARLERIVREHASRGRLEITLNLVAFEDNVVAVNFNAARAQAMLDAVHDFSQQEGGNFEPDYNRFLNISSLWEEEVPDDTDDLVASLEEGLALVLEDWNSSRTQEAKVLETDLRKRVLHMEEWLGHLLLRAPEIKETRFVTVRTRLEEILEQHSAELEESRFLQEIAHMADRIDVSEELTRLGAHLERLQELLATGHDAGRRLDFTLQECFREISTCGNKIQDIQVAHLVVDFKNELEKCREQVQNLE